MELRNTEIVVAAKANVNRYLQQMMEIDRSYFSDEAWKEKAFLSELPEKFEASLLVVQNACVVAYLLVSLKETGYHIHKLVVKREFVSQGIGDKLLAVFRDRHPTTPLSLKVQVKNIKAIVFYLRQGFVFVENSGQYYQMIQNA